MRLSDLFFVLFYGLALGFVAYFVYRFLIKSTSNKTVIVEQPIIQYETPITEVVYPWYGGYSYGPWWGYNWGGGYGGPGYYGSRRHWGPRGGSTRPYGSSGSRGGGRIGGGGGPRSGGRGGGGRR